MSLQLIKQKFYSPDSGSGGGGGDSSTNLDDKTLNADAIYDLLGEEQDEVIKLDDDKGKEKGKEKPEKEDKTIEKEDKTTDDENPEDEEDDELKELEEELEGPKDEQLELVTPVRRKDILAKYPKLFQDFPYLEKAYYREQQFTEIYPTIDDAKSAQEKATTLDRFEGQLMKGQTEDILKAVKENDENSFHQVVDNYMVALFNTDQSAYYHILSNINKMTIAQMVQEGKRSGNEQLIAAATMLNQFIFGNTEWTPPTKLSKQSSSPEKTNIDTERRQFLEERYEAARDDLSNRLENAIKSTIEQNIDSQGVMTPYIKNSACADAMTILQKAINTDTRFQALQKKLWQAAVNENFSKASMDRIRSAFTTKAKTLLPAVLKKARNEALKGMGRRSKEENTQDTNDGTTRSSERPNNRTTTSSSSRGQSYTDKAKQIPKGMSTLEFLNSD